MLVLVAGVGVAILWFRFNVTPPARAEILPHDLLYYFYPLMDQVGRRLASGELPLWNPHSCSGLPLLAALQPAVFYPGTWLSAVLPADRVLSLLAFFHLLLGAASTALLFRAWGVAASLAGAFGVVFAFGCVLGQSFWPPEMATIAWFPWMVLCTEHIIQRERADRWWFGLVAGTALQLLAGFPQFALYGLQLLVPYAALRLGGLGLGLGQRWRRDGSREAAVAGAGRVVAALVLGAGIASVQLLPTFELLAASHRSEPFSAAEVHYLQQQPHLPRLLRNAVTPAPRATAFDLEGVGGYLGTGTLVLLATALIGRRRDPLVWCLAAGGALWIVLSDGHLGVGREVFRLYSLLPGIGHLRAPERLLFPGFTCLVALAALGADVCDRAATLGVRSRLAIAAGAVAATVMIVWLGSPGAGWRAALALAWIVLALVLPEQPAWRGAWRGIAAVLLIADVAAATGPLGSLRDLPTEAAEQMRLGPSVIPDATFDELKRRAGLSRVEFVAVGERVRPLLGVGALGGVYRLACYETLLPRQWAALSQHAGGPDLRSAVMSNIDPDRVPAIYDVASVVEVVRFQPPGRRADRRRTRASETQSLPNPDALPRAYLVSDYEVADSEAAIARLVSGDLDAHGSVLLDRDPGLTPNGAIPVAAPAQIVDYAPERVEISRKAPVAAMLVLTDTDAPGWHASVDGRAVPIYRANGLFRAVPVPEGEHRVVFVYAPSSLRVGFATSLLCAAAVAAVLVRGRRRGSWSERDTGS